MVSSRQTLPTVQVWDYLYKAGDATATTPSPLTGAEVRITLQYDRATTPSPITYVAPQTVVVTTDSNGYWTANLVPNSGTSGLSPSNTLYTVQTPYSVYQISVPTTGGPYQSSTIIANGLSALSPATTNVTGPLTVAGLFDAQTTATFDSNLKIKGPDPFVMLDYYATGDGVVDDTTAITNAIAALPAHGGIIICGPGKTYKFTTAVTFSKHVHLIGAGRDLDNTTSPPTVFSYAPAGTGTTAFTVSAGVHACVFEGFLLIQGNSSATTGGILLSGSFSNTLRDLTVMNFTGTGLALASTAGASVIWNKVDNIRVSNCATNLSLAGSTANAKTANANTFIGSQFYGASAFNLNLGDTCNENSFIGCDFSAGTTNTLVQVGDGTHVCRGNVFWAATAEGGGTGTTCFNLATASGPTIIQADCIATGAGAKVTASGTAVAFFYDNILATYRTFGNTGLQIDGSYNITASANIRHSRTAPAFAASYTPDANFEIHEPGALTGNLTINSPTNAATGARLTFILTQDVVGGRTVTWNAIFQKTWSDAGNVAFTRTATEFVYDGTNWVQVSAQHGWA